MTEAIIIITPGFAASGEDTTCLPMQQRFVKDFVQCFPRTELIIIALQYPFTAGQYCLFGATVYALGGKNRRGVFNHCTRYRAARLISRLVKQKSVAGIVSFWYGEAAWVAERAAIRHGLLHYTWLMGQDARSGNRYHQQLQIPGGRIIALSESLQGEFFKSYGVMPRYVISPGMDAIAQSSAQRSIDLLAVGSLIPLKQFEQFIQLVAALKKEYPLIKAELIGEGPCKADLIAAATQVGVKDLICFSGLVPHAEVLRQMQQAKILVHPSSYEGFSGVCQEALAAGAMVVSYTSPSSRDISNWYRATDLAEMESLCRRLLSNPLPSVSSSLGSMKDTARQVGDLFPALCKINPSVDAKIFAAPADALADPAR